MTDLLIARLQMALTLAFHITFAAVGIGMPLLMAIAEGRHLRTGDPVALDLARRWSKGTAILFAVGAVSGTVLSFELGLLWPGFMAKAGPVIGMPFSLEGLAFFTEAIFLGIYLYGWNRVPPRAHLAAGIVVAISGAVSGIFVVTANGWMNTPTGFDLVDGAFVNIRPLQAMLNPAALHETIHMAFASYVATGFAVAAVHAAFLLRNPNSAFHRRAFAIAAAVGAIALAGSLASGDLSAKRVAKLQPAKFAAMEAHYETERGAALRIGGRPDDASRTVSGGIAIPKLLSFLAANDFDAEVKGLEEFPEDEWPNTLIVHWAFDVMVGAGMLMAALALWLGISALRHRRLAAGPWQLRAWLAAGPLGFVAIQAGWIVTEVGRQPWVVYGIIRTEDAVTTQTGLLVPFIGFMALYAVLSVVLVFLLRRQFLETVPGETDRVFDATDHGVQENDR